MSAEFNSLDEFLEVQIDAWLRLGSDQKVDSISTDADEYEKQLAKLDKIENEKKGIRFEANRILEKVCLKDSIGDVNSDAKGSGARYNHGKPDYSLIPFATMADEARVWEYGAKKYSRNNWQKGMDWSVPFACLMRHMAAWQAGEELDQESLLPHLAHAMCNLRMLTLFAKNYPEGDNREAKWLADYRNDVKKEGEL